jgi:hypothetical protein
MNKCHECGKSHNKTWRPGNPLSKCEAEVNYDLGHLIIRGLPETNPLMINVRKRAITFKEYLEKLTSGV